eukprot:scaffold339740_cov39-Attheya_sp.AAC.1
MVCRRHRPATKAHWTSPYATFCTRISGTAERTGYIHTHTQSNEDIANQQHDKEYKPILQACHHDGCPGYSRGAALCCC